MNEQQNSEDIRKTIGRNIKAFREALNISQVDLAKAMQYNEGSIRSAVSQIEKGKKGITLEKLKLAADFFGVTCIDLIYPVEYSLRDIKLIVDLHRLMKQSDSPEKSVLLDTIKILISQSEK